MVETREIAVDAATREALAVTLAEQFASYELFRSIPATPEQNHLSLTRQVNVYVGGLPRDGCIAAVGAMLAELGGRVGLRFVVG